MKHIINIITLAVFFNTALMAQDLPERPKRLVNDYAGLLNSQEVNYLERKLVNYNDTTSTQITVLIVNSLNGYDIVDYAQRVGQKWGAGQKGKDNGVIIVIKPKTASGKGEVNIDVGYGLEPIIPDITAQRIIDNEMIPHFKNDDYIGGLDAATNVIIALAAGQFSADEYNKGNGGGSAGGFFIPIIVLIIVISMINRRRRGTYSTGAGGSSLPLWTALWLGSTMGRGHGGSWNNFNSGSGGFGGGGGFGGFGGGGFGGGGASGSW